MFLLVPAYPGCPGSKAVKRSLLLLLLLGLQSLRNKGHTNISGFYSIMNEHPFNGPFSGTTRVSQYEKGKTNLDFTEARDSEWQWHQLGHMQVCIAL